MREHVKVYYKRYLSGAVGLGATAAAIYYGVDPAVAKAALETVAKLFGF